MKILITGGAGFIGVNAASFFLQRKSYIIIFDNFSRKGNQNNAEWLKKLYGENLKIINGDIRFDSKRLTNIIKDVDVVLHFAGQVAVTASVENPREDFESNALGTLNVLEAIREAGNNPICIYSSTNKVYGGLEDVEILETPTKYAFKNLPFGVAETHNLDFHSPYGCSKGAAEQYVRDYARIYGLNTIVFRQSCIYGPHQFGIEDQGWLAWFIIAIMLNKQITIYGNGKQVRDVLYIDDLLSAYEMGIKNIKKTRGQIYNIGGGITNTISIWHELQSILENLFEKKIDIAFSDKRPGDQNIFISDIRKAKKEFGWEPKVNITEGVEKLFTWIQANRRAIEKVFT